MQDDVHFNLVFKKREKNPWRQQKLKNCYRWEKLYGGGVRVCGVDVGRRRKVAASGVGWQWEQGETLLTQGSGIKPQRCHWPLPVAKRRFPCRCRATTSHETRCYNDLI